jgi:lipopolysaccharide heptosyltransferase II
MKKVKLKGREKFLIVRTDRIGDVVLSLPVLEAIKRKYPDSQVTMLVSSYTRDLLLNNPWVDETIIDEQAGLGQFYRLARLIREGKFDVAVLLRPTLRLALLLFLSRIKVRIGTGYRAYQVLFNYKIYQHRKTIERHELEYNLDMLAPLGISSEGSVPRIFLSAEEGKSSRRMLEDLNVNPQDTKIVIHPGSGHSSLNYPLEKLALLADKLIEGFSARIVLTGSKKESDISEKLKGSMVNQPIDLTGKTDLRALCALLNAADLFISSSTGPMHVAAALGTPVVALFSPLFVASPKRWGPYGEEHEVVLPPVSTCYKCEPEKCSYFNCMDMIEPDEILSRVKNILSKKFSHTR